jgi:hypothetical protein
MIWYRISVYGDAPEPIEIKKETSKFVFVKGKTIDDKPTTYRDAKETSYRAYFPTAEACWVWRIGLQEGKVLATRQQLAREEQELARLRTKAKVGKP